MIRSMTGYGSAATESAALRATVTVRSLNHRFLETTVHLSRRLQPMEREIRDLDIRQRAVIDPPMRRRHLGSVMDRPPADV